MDEPSGPKTGRDARSLRMVAFLLMLSVAGLCVWAIYWPLEVRVVASGEILGDKDTVEVRSNISAPVLRVDVLNGDTVRTGQVLVRFNEEGLDRQKSIAEATIAKDACRIAALEEQLALLQRSQPDLVAAIESVDPSKLATLFQYRPICEAESSSLSVRLLAETLGLKIVQIRNFRQDVSNLQSQIDLTVSQLNSLQNDVGSLASLAGRQIFSDMQVRALARQVDQARISLANYQSRRSELLGNSGEVQEQARVEVTTQQRAIAQDLQLARTKLSDEETKLSALNAELERRTLRAPVAGTVVFVSAFTTRNYVQQSEMVLKIFPNPNMRLIRARVPINEIDNIGDKKNAVVRFPTYARLRDSLLSATIETINPITSEDVRSGRPDTFYEIVLRISDPSFEGMPFQFTNGAPAEILFNAERTTLARAILHPITKNWPRLFEK